MNNVLGVLAVTVIVPRLLNRRRRISTNIWDRFQPPARPLVKNAGMRARPLLALSGVLLALGLAGVSAQAASGHQAKVADAWQQSYDALTNEIVAALKAHATFMNTVTTSSWRSERPQLAAGAESVRVQFKHVLAGVKAITPGTPREQAVTAKLETGLSDYVDAYGYYVDGFRRGSFADMGRGDTFLRVATVAFTAAGHLYAAMGNAPQTPFEQELNRLAQAVGAVGPLITREQSLFSDLLNRLKAGGISDPMALADASQGEALLERIVAAFNKVSAFSDPGLQKALVEFRQGWTLVRDGFRDYVAGLRSRKITLVQAGDTKEHRGANLTGAAEQTLAQLVQKYLNG
jgi:hypothetical protein